MTAPTTLKAEERAARDRLQAVERARAAKAKATTRRRADIVREAPREGVPMPDHAADHARAAPRARRRLHRGQWVCPTLDAIRRRLGA